MFAQPSAAAPPSPRPWSQVPFSAGQMEASHPSGNDCRAINLHADNCDYFARATDPTTSGDMGGILDPHSVAAWGAAMADDTHWRHVAATDDGTTVTVYGSLL